MGYDTTMHLESGQDPQAFYDATKSFLGNEPEVHSLILSLATRYAKLGKSIANGVIARGETGHIVGAALQTDAHYGFLLSKLADTRGFARELAKMIAMAPGFQGPVPVIDEFVDEWSKRTATTFKLGSNLRLFECTKVTPPALAPQGHARLATVEDKQKLFTWARAFADEAVPHDPRSSDEDLMKDIEQATKLGQFYIWDDGGAVAWAASRRETATEKWIAPVYTPPEKRGRGYASGLVAFMTEQFLKQNKKGMLFTDLANPTSNSIYQQVGYKPLADFKHYVST